MASGEKIEICPWSGKQIKRQVEDVFSHEDAKRLAELEQKMSDESYWFASADHYYSAKQAIRELRAKKVGLKSWQYDQMGYAFDMQSN